MNDITFLFFYHVFKIWSVFYRMAHFGLAKFQVLNDHTWLAAPVLGSGDLKNFLKRKK